MTGDCFHMIHVLSCVKWVGGLDSFAGGQESLLPGTYEVLSVDPSGAWGQSEHLEIESYWIRKATS